MLKTVNQFFCNTHCFMIIHHHTMFGKKKKRKIVEQFRRYQADAIRHRSELHTQMDEVNPISPPPPHIYWMGITKKVKLFRRYSLDKHSMKVKTPRCDLEHEHRTFIFSKVTPVYESKFSCKRISTSVS